jgi:hypothetical protein
MGETKTPRILYDARVTTEKEIPMSHDSVCRLLLIAAMLGSVVLASAAPAEAQREFQPLFDKFSFKAEFSWVKVKTEIRLDSELLGRGTTLNFENDLKLGDLAYIPSLDFEWQIAKRHKLAGRWQRIDRSSSSQSLREINWGDEVIPIDAEVNLDFNISQFYVDYTYYPWVKERWAAGFGLGLRWMEIQAILAWNLDSIQEEGSSDVKGTGPLPYLYFEYRRLFSEDWRFITGLGWLQVKVGDIDGGQWIWRGSIEYLLGERWAFGAAINLSSIDVDWKGLDDANGDPIYTGAITMPINDISLFARVRF